VTTVGPAGGGVVNKTTGRPDASVTVVPLLEFATGGPEVVVVPEEAAEGLGLAVPSAPVDLGAFMHPKKQANAKRMPGIMRRKVRHTQALIR